MQRSQILVQNRVFCLPHLQSTPPLGRFPSEYRHPAWYGKTRMVWLPDGEKISKISLFVLTQLTNVTDRQTHTHTAWRHKPRLCIASRGKKPIRYLVRRQSQHTIYRAMGLKSFSVVMVRKTTAQSERHTKFVDLLELGVYRPPRPPSHGPVTLSRCPVPTLVCFASRE